MNTIDYNKLIKNLEDMINILEYDSMRGTGKAKLNAQQIESMYNNLDRYKAMVAKAPKKTPAKEG